MQQIRRMQWPHQTNQRVVGSSHFRDTLGGWKELYRSHGNAERPGRPEKQNPPQAAPAPQPPGYATRLGSQSENEIIRAAPDAGGGS